MRGSAGRRPPAEASPWRFGIHGRARRRAAFQSSVARRFAFGMSPVCGGTIEGAGQVVAVGAIGACERRTLRAGHPLASAAMTEVAKGLTYPAPKRREFQPDSPQLQPLALQLLDLPPQTPSDAMLR